MEGITEKLAFKLKIKRINKEYRIIWKSVECCIYTIQKLTKKYKEKWKICNILEKYSNNLQVQTDRPNSQKISIYLDMNNTISKLYLEDLLLRNREHIVF